MEIIARYLGTKIPEPEEEDVSVAQLNFEIECPRCSDVMGVFIENFDHLSYYLRGLRIRVKCSLI